MSKPSNSKTRLAKARLSARLPLGLGLPLLAGIVCPGAASAQDEPPPQETYFKKGPAEHFSFQPCRYFRTEGSVNNPREVWKEGCFTHFVQLSDLDDDSDLDVLFASGGGYFAVGEAEPSAFYKNDGKAGLLYMTDYVFAGALNRSRQVLVADIDGDGDKDIYQPGSWGAHVDGGDKDMLWVQTAPGVWENQAARRLPGNLKHTYTSASFGDLDGDGDLDFVAADWGNNPNKSANTSLGAVHVYLNNGAGYFSMQPSHVVPGPLPLVLDVANGVTAADWGNTPLDIDLSDFDGDFDLDIVVTNRNGRGQLFLNDGTGVFTDGNAGFPAKTRSTYSYNTEVCDLDGDGDLDILTDNAGQKATGGGAGATRILINDGTGVFVEETLDRISGDPYGDDNAVKCADVDGDGDYDLITSTLQYASEKLFLNDGTGKFTFVASAFKAEKDPSLGIAVGDLNGDGILDVVTGQGEQSPQINAIHLGTGESKADITPPKFRAYEQPEEVEPGEVIVLRMGVADAHTSETGEHVRSVSVTYSVDGGAEVELPAYFTGGDLFRVDLPAQEAGSVITVKPSATDRQNNVSAEFSFEIKVKGEKPVVGDGDGDGEPVGDGDGDGEPVGDGDGDGAPVGDGDGDGAPVGDGDGDGAPVGDGDGDDEPVGDGDGDGDSTGGDGDSAGEPTKSDSSSGCSVSGSENSTSAGLFSLLGLAFLGFRNRRRSQASR